MNVGSRGEAGGLACEVSKGSLNTLSGPFTISIVILLFWSAQAEQSSMINKRPIPLK